MKKAIDMLQKVQIAVGGVFLVIFLFTVVFQIMSRYLGIVAVWTEDVSTYSFIWAVFMGGAAMVYERKHFAFTSIADSMKDERKKKIIAIVISIVILIFSLLMLYYGYSITKQFWNYKWVSIPALKRGPTWMCLPICGLTSAIYALNHIVEDAIAFVKGGEA